jgi:hypothetical protein
MKTTVRTLLGAAAIALSVAGGSAPLAQESSSPDYVMQRAALTAGGGESSSPGYVLLAATGQCIEGGGAEGVAFAANAGFHNDIDLDGDGILGPEDLCPGQFAGCWDADANGCVDVPDPDGDGDGVTLGQCDCDDLMGEVWRTPGEARNLRLSPLTGAEALLEWDPPLEAGCLAPTYEVLRSADAADFLAQGTVCLDPGLATTVTDPEAGAVGEILFYLARAKNGCPVSQGILGHTANDVLRAGRACTP